MKSERGITIIETTVILSVLFILAGAMSPIVSESVTTARAVKAKSDASMIAMGLINLQNDLGGDSLSLAEAPVTTKVGLPDVLASEGQQPSADDPEDAVDESLVANPVQVLLKGSGQNAASNPRAALRAARRRWREGTIESLDDHLYTNRRGYRFRRPGESGGWNGPYISAHLKSDPWGNEYMINSRWFDGGSTVADSQGRPRRAVFVVSAGANGVIETPYEQTMIDAKSYGDDVAVRVQ
jgi:type II secretory pathway pseudopilin PulG